MNLQMIRYAVLSCIIFIFLSLTYNMHIMMLIDTVVSSFVQSIRNPTLTHLFLFFTTVGSMRIYIPLSLLLFIYYVIQKRFASSLLILVCLYGSDYINKVLKSFYHRSRPDVQTLISASGYSFPSGHAMNATAFLGFVAYLAITEHRLNLGEKIMLIFVSSLLILAIALSRVYLGVHYLSDIVAGIAAGFGWMFLCILFHQKLKEKI